MIKSCTAILVQNIKSEKSEASTITHEIHRKLFQKMLHLLLVGYTDHFKDTQFQLVMEELTKVCSTMVSDKLVLSLIDFIVTKPNKLSVFMNPTLYMILCGIYEPEKGADFRNRLSSDFGNSLTKNQIMKKIENCEQDHAYPFQIYDEIMDYMRKCFSEYNFCNIETVSYHFSRILRDFFFANPVFQNFKKKVTKPSHNRTDKSLNKFLLPLHNCPTRGAINIHSCRRNGRF